MGTPKRTPITIPIVELLKNDFDIEGFAPTFVSAGNAIDGDIEITEPGTITYKMTVADKHLSSPNTAHGAALAGFYLGHRRIPGSLSVEELRAALESLIHRLTLLAAPPNRG